MSAPALRIVCTFQSTLSVRRATDRAALSHGNIAISIHALREESDHRPGTRQCDPTYFNPRSP